MIFLLESVYKDYLWGGEKLRTHYHKDTALTPLAESWEISCHPDGESMIACGLHKGDSLSTYLSQYPMALGTNGATSDRFPVLVKLIDAKKDLSVQVHPNDDYGLRVENELGKTEVWYVLEADPGAELIMGYRKETSKEAVEKAVEEGSLMEILNRVPVVPGDVFFIEAGTVHGIGGGITLIEIQQNSNTTYRVYDYDRVGKDGNKRPLHLDKALDVMTYGPAKRRLWEPPVIAHCEYFHVEAHSVDGSAEFTVTAESFHGLTCVEGSLDITQGEHVLTLIKGSSAFVTAEETTYTVSGQGKVIVTTLP